MNCLGAAPHAGFWMATSRTDRDLARGRCAAARVRIQGGSALAGASAQIGATFSPAIRHSIFKDRVAAVMRHGITRQEVRSEEGTSQEDRGQEDRGQEDRGQEAELTRSVGRARAR